MVSRESAKQTIGTLPGRIRLLRHEESWPRYSRRVGNSTATDRFHGCHGPKAIRCAPRNRNTAAAHNLRSGRATMLPDRRSFFQLSLASLADFETPLAQQALDRKTYRFPHLTGTQCERSGRWLWTDARAFRRAAVAAGRFGPRVRPPPFRRQLLRATRREQSKHSADLQTWPRLFDILSGRVDRGQQNFIEFPTAEFIILVHTGKELHRTHWWSTPPRVLPPKPASGQQGNRQRDRSGNNRDNNQRVLLMCKDATGTVHR